MNLHHTGLTRSLSTTGKEWTLTGFQLFPTGNTYSSQLLLVPLFPCCLGEKLVICTTLSGQTRRSTGEMGDWQGIGLLICVSLTPFTQLEARRLSTTAVNCCPYTSSMLVNSVFHLLLHTGEQLEQSPRSASLGCAGWPGKSHCIVNVPRVTGRTSSEYMNNEGRLFFSSLWSNASSLTFTSFDVVVFRIWFA